MEFLKNDYNIISATVKVYDKTYKRKNKYGNQSTVKTVQKIITLNKSAPFSNGDNVIILSVEDYHKFLRDNKVEINKDQFQALEKKVRDKDQLIQELESKLKNESETIKEIRQTYQETISSQNNLISKLEAAAIEDKTRIQSLEDKNRELENKIDDHQAINNKLKNDNKELSVALAGFIGTYKSLMNRSLLQRILNKSNVEDEEILNNSLQLVNSSPQPETIESGATK